ncbi:nucleocapsid protein [Persimmon virus A]|uniref:Nucleoprotein n=1 Tax=Persimmon virus A TaxID=1211480 RepID=R4WAJ4_9RHAB|nr:nucleocapsid protein [Persimmon virus A]BAM36030.2 nucleocapsid protein [Persimmon virus A]
MSTVAERLAALRAAKKNTPPPPTKNIDEKKTEKDDKDQVKKDNNVSERRAMNTNRYSAVSGLTGGGKMITKTWNDDTELPNIPIYSLSEITVDQLCVVGAATIKRIKNGDTSNLTVDGLIYLATSLRDPSNPEVALLTAPTAKFGAPAALTIDLTNTDSQQATNPKISVKAQKLIDRRKKEASQIVDEEEKKNDDVSSVSKEGQASAYCFIAAYLMRLYSRTAESFCASLDLMRSRFGSWYTEGSSILDSFEMEETIADDLKGMLSKKPNILNTWVMWVAFNENASVLDRNNRGLMEYLAGQIFSYTSLHVVTQTLAIQQYTKCDMAMLLSELESPMTRGTVQELYKLIRDYEVTTLHPDRTTFFRYARNWDAGYFAPLQTKKCTNLVYLTASVIKLIAPTGARSDPTKIYGLSDLGEMTKTKLDKVAMKLSDLLTRVEGDENTGSCWIE